MSSYASDGRCISKVRRRWIDVVAWLLLLIPTGAGAIALTAYPGHSQCCSIIFAALAFGALLGWLTHRQLKRGITRLLLVALLAAFTIYTAAWIAAPNWLRDALLAFPRNAKPIQQLWIFVAAPSFLVEFALTQAGFRLPWMIELSTKVVLLLLYWWTFSSLLKSAVDRGKGALGTIQTASPTTPNSFLPLFLVSLVAVSTRLFASVGLHAPVGWDVPIYIATLEHRVSPHEFPLMTKGAHLTFEAIGAFLQPLHKPYWIRVVELLPLLLMALGAVGAYGLVHRLTGSQLAAAFAGVFFATSPGILRHTSDLYKCLMGVALSIYAAHCFLCYLKRRDDRLLLPLAIMVFSLMLTHPYPASIFIYAMLAVALVLTARKEASWLRWSWAKKAFVGLLVVSVTYLIVYGRVSMYYEEVVEVPVRLLFDFVSNFSPIVFVLTLAGLFYAFFEEGYGGKLLVLWLLSSVVLAEQSLFYAQFPLDTPDIPRFVYVSSVPACVLAAVGLSYVLKLLGSATRYIRYALLAAITVVACLYAISYFEYCSEMFGVRITQRDFIVINWLGRSAPFPSNSISPFYFDPWTGRIGYVNLQNLEFVDFYYVKSIRVEMDKTPLTDRILDVGYPVHRINALDKAYDFESVSGLR